MSDLVKRLQVSTASYWDEDTQSWVEDSALCDEAADRIEELEAERDAALVALFECMEEIDAYIQQEYPHDHPVQERYRQRDYAANPARIFLRERPDALVKARAMLAEADLKRQTTTLAEIQVVGRRPDVIIIDDVGGKP
jgi:hypothetical protein